MSYLLFQTFLLMAASYFLGAFLGCMWRRVIYTVPHVADVDARDAGLAGAVAGTAAGLDVATAKPAVAARAGGQPEIEFTPPAAGVSDATRFERALSGRGTLEPRSTSAAVETKPAHETPRPAPSAEAASASVAKPADSEPPTIITVPSAPVTSPIKAPYEAAPYKAPSQVPSAVAAAAAAAAAAVAARAGTSAAVQSTPAERVVMVPPAAAATRPEVAGDATIKPAPAMPGPIDKPTTPAQPFVTAKTVDTVTEPQPTSRPGVPASSGGMSGTVADVRIGAAPQPTAKPADAQDLTLIRGIDDDTARALNARGVWRYGDIARWTHVDVDAVNAALGVSHRIERENWIEQAAVLGAGGMTEYARRKLQGGSPAAGASAASVTENATAPSANASAIATAAAAAVAAAASTVVAATSTRQPTGGVAPKATDAAVAAAQDLTLIRGVDEAAARVLDGRGIRSFADIARWKQADVDAINAALSSPRRIEHEGWIEQASVLATGTMTDYAKRRLRGEQAIGAPSTPVAEPRPVAEVPASVASAVAASAPPSTPPAKSPASTANAVAAAVAAAAASASRGAVAQDRKPAAAPAAPAAQAPSAAPAQAKPAVAAAGVAAPLAPAADMLQRIRGVDAATERALHANGITRFRQIAGWSETEAAQFDAVLASPGRVGREGWVEQAAILAGSTDPVDAASRPARLADAIRENTDRGARAPRSDVGALRSVRSEALKPTGADAGRVGGARAAGPGDDLKRIRGIGVLIEKKLNALGFASYEQIANWTVPDIERVSEQLDFRGRIERENWIEQARILSAGGQTEFSRRLDRGEIQ